MEDSYGDGTYEHRRCEDYETIQGVVMRMAIHLEIAGMAPRL